MKRALVFTLAMLLLLGLAAGCGGPVESTTSPSAPTEPVVSGSPVTPSEEPAASLPITDTLTTFTAWWPLTGNEISYISTINDVKCMIELENRTNIHLEVQQPAKGTEQESFNLMIVSQQLADFFHDRGYTGGAEKAVNDGFYLKLNDYVDRLMPYYSELLKSDPEIERQAKTDNGYITAVYTINDNQPWPWAGIQIRKDWLEDVGLSAPITYGDWEVMLTAFRDEKGASSPMTLDRNGNFMYGEFSAGFGVNMGLFQRDGKVFYSPLEDEYAEYLRLLNDWYAKGLIQQDFYSDSVWASAYTKGFNGDTGVIWGIPQLGGNNYVLNGVAKDENLFYQGVASPKVNPTDEPAHFMCNPTRTGQGFSVSADCRNPELLIRWLDYGYSPDGSLLYSFGVEGESLEFIDGKPQYTNLVVNNPDIPFDTARYLYCINAGPYLAYTYRHLRYTTGDQYAVLQENAETTRASWLESDSKYMLPEKRSVTAEEGTEYSTIFSDIETLVSEMTLKVITGQESPDTWSGVVDQIKSMNINRVIEIQQAALDRYYNR